LEEIDDERNETGYCVPEYSPGLKFWESSDASAICGQATTECVVQLKKIEKMELDASKKTYVDCISNCECLGMKDGDDGDEGEMTEDAFKQIEPNKDWAKDINEVCVSLGDCGLYRNFVGETTDDGYQWKYGNEIFEFTKNDINSMIPSNGQLGITGRAITETGGIQGLLNNILG
jgi:hypothetical protein